MYITYDINTRRLMRIDDNLIDLGQENLKVLERDISFDDDICNNICIYRVDENENFYIDEELVVEHKLNILRIKREPLLIAFDTYKSNLFIGVLSLSNEEQQEVIDWYHLILDLNEEVINNPPKAIARYL